MESGHHQLQQQHYVHNPYLNVTTQEAFAVPSGSTAAAASGGGDQRERFPQWTHLETRELLALRWNLDQSFMEMKRNKLLWEVISTKMKEKGFHRSPDQCKCKWKNLVTGYKGSESMVAETNRQFPFQEEMRRIFSDRMQRFLDFDDGRNGGVQQLQVWSDEEEDTLIEDKERQTKKKRKMAVRAGDGSASNSGAGGGREDAIKNTLRNFMDWQIRMDAEWMKISEAREVERRAMDMKWRNSMEALAAERADIDRRWRAKEEERRAREEERAEGRHELLVALLTKLT